MVKKELDKLCIILLGDFPELSEKEVLFCLNSINFPYEYLFRKDLLLFLKCDSFIAPYLTWRCSSVRHVIKLIAESSLNEIINILKKINFEINKEKSVCVKVKSYDVKYKKYVVNLQKEIGSIFYERGHKINLKNPDVLIYCLIKDEKIYVGILLSSSIRKFYEIRKPSKRPFFHPSSMVPRISRLLVNLSLLDIVDILIDPFCGSGGILIEASFIANYCIGIDIDKKMIYGAKKNIHFFKINNVDLILANSLKLPLRRIKFIATDTPYGIASSLKGKDRAILITNFLKEIHSIDKAKICLATTLENLNPKNFSIIFKKSQFVRKSLIRWIYTLENND